MHRHGAGPEPDVEVLTNDHWSSHTTRPYMSTIGPKQQEASYGEKPVPIHSIALAVFVLMSAAVPAIAETLRIVALGDSLTAGYGLASADSLTGRLEAALRERGHDVVIVNAGVSGDTASDGLARVDWSVGEDADAVIVELGANDALRGVDPAITRDALDRLLARLSERGLPVLLGGMLAPPNMGAPYAEAFNPLYPELAQKHDALLYPFFLDGVATRADLNQPDRIHPNAEGVAIIVERLLPSVEALIERIETPEHSGALQRVPHYVMLSLIREGGTPCRACSPALKSPPISGSVWPSSAAASPAPAGSTRKTIT
jgi:acyl-CoA thioesterase I